MALKALVVGSGWGRHHAQAYSDHSGVELCGIVGRKNSERSQKLAKQYATSLYDSLDGALAEVKPDIVSVATKEAEHEAVTVAALEAGAAVYCEKMMAHSLASARRMVEAAERTGQRLMAGYNYRFSPSAEVYKQWIVEGKLGTLSFISGVAFSYCMHHTCDLICHLAGSPVTEVFCVFDPDPDFKTVLPLERYEDFLYSAGRVRANTLRFANGTVANLISSDAMRVGHAAVRVESVGTEGRAVMDDIVGDLTFFGADRESVGWRPSLIRDRLDLGSTTTRAVTAFCDAIAKDEPTPVPGTDGLNRLIVEAALLRSGEQNRPVKLSEFD